MSLGRRSMAVLVAAAGAIALSGCSGASTPAPSPSPWEEAPTDGTWSSGDVAFGDVTPIRENTIGPRDEYSFRITAAPAVTTTDGGETILVASPLTVVRVHDQGLGDDLSVSESFIFIPGERSQPMNEAYGTDPDVICDAEQLAIGETATCTIAFEAEPSEVQDSYWQINGFAVGTWPSQTHTG